MVRVKDVLGISAYALLKYDVRPEDDVFEAIEVLQRKAPHVAKLLKAVVESNGAS
ncbi:MAG: hypothetical protein ABWK05_06990 [Pyrobaculum sp.]